MKPPALGSGDFEFDGDIDLDDFAEFVPCLGGPGEGLTPGGCGVFDFELDGDVDLRDFAAFQIRSSGSGPIGGKGAPGDSDADGGVPIVTFLLYR